MSTVPMVTGWAPLAPPRSISPLPVPAAVIGLHCRRGDTAPRAPSYGGKGRS